MSSRRRRDLCITRECDPGRGRKESAATHSRNFRIQTAWLGFQICLPKTGFRSYAKVPRSPGMRIFWDAGYNRNQLRGGCRRRPAYPFILAIIAIVTNCLNTLLVATNSLLGAKIPCEPL